MKKLLIVNTAQFGYHIDTAKYCEYLRSDYSVTYLGFDYDKPRIPAEDINVIYISRSSNKFRRYSRFLRAITNEIRSGGHDVVFIVYFLGASWILRTNSRQIFNIDIRTGYDTPNKYKNSIMNFLMRNECRLFKNVTIVSNSLRQYLGMQKCHILPLGGEIFSTKQNCYNELKLLYVGTLENRKMLECIRGFHKFLQENPDSPAIRFKIIGDSPGNELKEIQDYVDTHDLSRYISTEGYIPNNKLSNFFEESNIGVSFVPMTRYYDNQPPTKTYEYLLSGLPVIATNTKENRLLIKAHCGVLIEDTAAGFADGLKDIRCRRRNFNSQNIRNSWKGCTWRAVVENNLKPYLESLTRTKELY